MHRIVETYSWNSHGNIGDDWISSVAADFLANPRFVSESRLIRGVPFGGYRLKQQGKVDPNSPLCLWGGGWLAADQGNSETILRWTKHLQKRKGEVTGIGLGLGPFEGSTNKQLAKQLFSYFTVPLVVRTESDLRAASGIATAELGGDATFLDNRYATQWKNLLDTDSSNITVLSFPRYGKHWRSMRSWLTEDWYKTFVESIAKQKYAEGEVIHVEFDNGQRGSGDNKYWSDLPGTFLAPRTIEEAAVIFSNAKEIYAGRLHAALLAVQLNKPVSALAYHHKFECVIETGAPVVGIDSEPTRFLLPERADPNLVSMIRERTYEVSIQHLPRFSR